ncbi:MAG: ADP-ribosylglycohydrolase family protein [Capsulimonadaceae bacterium]
MLGAIAGDILGSIYEFNNIKTADFPLFDPRCTYTDDTVLTVAVASVLLGGSGGNPDAYVDAFHEWYRNYPLAGYGGGFQEWARSELREPYGSWGNGSAMRVSPVAWACDSLDDALQEATVCAGVTHDHPEGIRGAQAVAAAVFLARQGESKPSIRRWLDRLTHYDLETTLDAIRPSYRFDVSCQGSVPPAIIAFLESTGYEDAVRKAISLGGDSDTIACIAGAIAEAAYGGVPAPIASFALASVDDTIRTVIVEFAARYHLPLTPGDTKSG